MAKVFGKKKVVVVGDGRVGSSAVFALFQQSWINEVGVIDVVLPGHKDENGEWVKGFNAMHNVEGDALDMNDGASFLDGNGRVVAANWSDEPGKEGCDYSICDDADAVVITSGAPQKPGQTRLELLGANASIVAGVCKQLKSHLNDHCVVIVVSNPCDVLAWVAYKTLAIDSKKSEMILESTIVQSMPPSSVSTETPKLLLTLQLPSEPLLSVNTMKSTRESAVLSWMLTSRRFTTTSGTLLTMSSTSRELPTMLLHFLSPESARLS